MNVKVVAKQVVHERSSVDRGGKDIPPPPMVVCLFDSDKVEQQSKRNKMSIAREQVGLQRFLGTKRANRFAEAIGQVWDSGLGDNLFHKLIAFRT